MRLFYGLEPSQKEKLALEQWRQKNFNQLPNPVRTANFHITLAFLGQVDNGQLELIEQEAEAIESSQFSICIDQVGYWPKPKVLWIGPKQYPEELHQLAQLTRKVANRYGDHKETRHYIPHISLFRKQKDNPPPALFQPNLRMMFDHFCLYESLSGKHGVQYKVLHRWQLN